ncbi:translation initiation factor IF-2 [Chitinophaga barathri]|uniref:Translation initiation factor IF-2 n=1 Tax=Chitinophaga barathri TaxID=1647451 RepID=A0A3N4M5P5_9BACT|nr:translation initiation factor IF-2 [Chitinophaga barathri]RPD38511.1 translation initiation factor IF-2 [Chitinophaga barathri]
MPEVTNNTPRLLAAAKEFNIGKDTLVEFLANKGFDMDGFGSPNAKLTAQMYNSLQQEFQQDKANKRKSDQIALPKGTVLDAAKKKEKEEAELAAKKKEEAEAATKKKEEAQPKAEPQPEPEAPKPAPAPKPEVKAEKPEPKPEPQPEPKPVAEVKPEPKPEPKAEPKPEPAPEPQAKAPEAPAPAPQQEEAPKAEAPRVAGPKIMGTIDLDALNAANRSKKPAAKKEQPEEKAAPAPRQDAPAPEPTEAPATPAPKAEVKEEPKKEEPKEVKAEKPAPAPKAEEKPAEATPPPAKEPKAPEVVKPAATKEAPAPAAPAPQAAPEAADSNDPAVIENIQATRLSGPKVIGKIELPVAQERRDNKNFNKDEKRKRKRIVIEKKPEPIKPGEFAKEGGQGGPGNRDNRGPGGGGGQHQGGNRGPGGGGGHHQGGNRGPGGGGQHQGGNRGPGGGQGGNRGPGGGGGHHQGGNRPAGAPGGGPSRPHQRRDQRPGQGGGGYGQGAPRRPDDKEIDKNEIQNKIKETMAKLGGNSRGKNTKASRRRDKRHEMAERREAQSGADGNKLQVTEFVSVSELANLMDVSFAEVISKCMGLGIMVSINQRLDAEVIELVAGEFGYEVEFIGIDDATEEDEEEIVDDPEDLTPRAPIVTIMGHVDHGKTSLLDYIRSANVVAGEAGGITQHIGAYQVTTASGKKLTFLDTPGHEAFTAMRARGAKVADIAVIVVAADDAIMPQTREAISHSQAAGLPMVFAINKIDKDGANPEKIKEQLAGMNLLVEDWGGKYQSQEISAKSGLNIDVLLEKILLEAELLELKANPDREAIGTVIEATLDKGRGYVTTVLVQNGTLEQGDTIVSGAHFGKIKAMFNERGQRVEKAGPSAPVQLLGLNGAPQAGEKFRMYEDESEAKDIANRRAQIVREQGIRTKKHITLDEIGRRLALGNFKQLNLIIKGDVDGSVEALSDSLQKLSTEEIVVSVVLKGVGQITESDVLLATASDALIIGFQVRPSMNASRLAEKENIEIRTYSIIYDAIDELKSAMEGMLEPKIEKKVTANVEIRETYKFDKATVAGCYVLDGKLFRNSRINLVRDGIVVHTGELQSLKRYKDDVKEVVSGMECGLSIKNYSDLKVGDIVEGFEEVEVKRTL